MATTPTPCPDLAVDGGAAEGGESAGGLLIDHPCRPTDRPTGSVVSEPYPHYLSLRVTIKHEQWDDVYQCIYDYDYVAYPHKGSATGKQHFHVFIPLEFEQHRVHSDRIRKRLKTSLGLSGNGDLSLKSMSNGLWQAVQYGSKEGTAAFVSDDVMRLFVDAAPKWDPSKESRRVDYSVKSTLKEDRSEKDWQLSYTNLVTQAVIHARKRALAGSLKAVVKDMLQTTKWRPSKYVLNGGVPEFYERDFDYRMGKRKEQDMDWWTPRTI